MPRGWPRPAADAVAEPDPRRRLLVRRPRPAARRSPSRRRHNASHGLVRWAAWTVEEHTPHSVSLGYRLMAQSGYPWTLDLHVLYDLSADGLTVTQTATQHVGATPRRTPRGRIPTCVGGRRPRRRAGAPAARVDPAARGRPAAPGRPRAGRGHAVRLPGAAADPGRRPSTTAFTDLDRGRRRAWRRVELRDPATGRGVALWADGRHRWLQVFSGDDRPGGAPRRSLAVEPMTAPAGRLPLRRRPGHPRPRRRAR